MSLSKGWIAIIVLIALGGLYGAHRGIVAYEVKQAVQTNTVSINLKYQKDLAVATEQAVKATNDLRDQADSAKAKKYEQIESRNAALSVAIKRLQNRPLRPAPQPSGDVASVGGSCTAAQLYREDSEFLTREATRAESVLDERDYYYNAYETARKKLDGYGQTTVP